MLKLFNSEGDGGGYNWSEKIQITDMFIGQK